MPVGKGLRRAAAAPFRAALAPHPIASFPCRLGLALLAGGDSADAKLELERARDLDPSLAETKDKFGGKKGKINKLKGMIYAVTLWQKNLWKYNRRVLPILPRDYLLGLSYLPATLRRRLAPEENAPNQ